MLTENPGMLVKTSQDFASTIILRLMFTNWFRVCDTKRFAGSQRDYDIHTQNRARKLHGPVDTGHLTRTSAAPPPYGRCSMERAQILWVCRRCCRGGAR